MKSLKNIDDVSSLELYFVVHENGNWLYRLGHQHLEFGEQHAYELIPDGANVLVTKENAARYVC